MSMDRRHALIVNPAAGAGRSAKMLPRVERELARHGLRFRVATTRDAEHALQLATDAALSGEVPLLMSGDGMVGRIGGALAGGEVPIGIIPAGRGNDLARVLGIPMDAAGAADVVASGIESTIDVGDVNGRPFLGTASCGFDSDANRIANDTKMVGGRLVYLYAALRALAEWRPARFTVSADGEPITFSGYSVVVANSKAYGGGMMIAPGAELDDGRLDVVMTTELSKLRFLASLPKVFKGTHVEEPEVRVVRAAGVRVEADRPFDVYADGERLAELPATVSVKKGALRVLTPA
ncbi:MAG: diacylglycerol/lipid kinase family protein [Solirubrobacterales bacterium]